METGPFLSKEPRSQENSQAKQDNKSRFLATAKSEGALNTPPKGLTDEAKWIRQVDAVSAVVDNGMTASSWAKSRGFTREWGRKIFNEGIRNIWSNLSPQTQEQFPLNELLGTKKRPTDNVRKTEAVARETLSSNEIDEAVKGENDDETLQLLLDSIPDNAIRNMYKKSDSIAPLSHLVKELGFHHVSLEDIHFLEGVLAQNNVPVRRAIAGEVTRGGKKYQVSNIVVLKKHKERIRQVLEHETNLQKDKKSPITLVAGNWSGELPTSNIVKKRNEYSSLLKLVNALSGSGVSNILKQVGDLEGCPVPIFKVDVMYLYPKNREEELRVFLRKKLGIV